MLLSGCILVRGAEHLHLLVTRPELVWSDETRAHSCWENIGKPSVLSMSHSHRQRSVHHAQTCPLPRMVQTVSPESSDTIKCSTSLPTHQKPTFDFRDKGDHSLFSWSFHLRLSALACTADGLAHFRMIQRPCPVLCSPGGGSVALAAGCKECGVYSEHSRQPLKGYHQGSVL